MSVVDGWPINISLAILKTLGHKYYSPFPVIQYR